MFSDFEFTSVQDIVNRGIYCAAVNTSNDDVELSAIFLKNGKIVDCSEALWFYNSLLKSGKPFPFFCYSMRNFIGFHLNGIYANENHCPEHAIISGFLNKFGIKKGTAIVLSKDWHKYIDADEVTFIVCSKRRFHSSNIIGRLLDYDNFSNSSSILSESIVSETYPNAISIQMFSLFSNNSIEFVSRASNLALLQDYVKSIS